MIKLKGDNLSLTHRFFVFNHDNILMVNVLAAFDCRTPDVPLPEDEVWALLKQACGKQQIMDEGILKSRAEFLVHGACYAPGNVPAKAVEVSVEVGALSKRLIVFGERFWLDESYSSPRISDPIPFSRMELGWDKAFGGPGYGINPTGKGAVRLTLPDGTSYLPLPNAEYPQALTLSPDARPEPACFSNLGSRRLWRGMCLGTYDDIWLAEHWPHPALDIDLDVINCACPDQWYDGYFTGGEKVSIKGMRPGGEVWQFHLPKLRARVFLRRQIVERQIFEELGTHFDTAWFFPETGRMVCIWRALSLVSSKAARDVTHMHAAFEPLETAQLPKEQYFALLDAPGPKTAREPGQPVSATEKGEPAPQTAAHVPEPSAPKPDAPHPAPPPVFTLPELQTEVAKIFSDAGLEPPPPDFTLKDLEAAVAKAFKDAGREPPPTPPSLAEMEGLSLGELLAQAERMASQAQSQLDAVLAKAGVAPKAFAPTELPSETELLAALSALDVKDPQLKQAIVQLTALAEQLEPPSTSEPSTEPSPPESLGPPPHPDTSRLNVEELMARAKATQNLANLNLTGLDFSGRDLSGVNLSGSILAKAVLRGCDLSGADLSEAILSGADFSQACCTGANFTGAAADNIKAEGALLSRANLTRTDLTGAALAKADLSGADLSRAVPETACLAGARLAGCIAVKTSFAGADLTGADLRGADLREANLCRTTLDGADLGQAKAERAWFSDASAKKTSFAQAGLTGCKAQGGSDFSGSDFSGANLSGAVIEECNLEKARLTATILDRASLRASRLQDADLSRALARRATFDEADLTRACLTGVNGLKASLREAVLHNADLRDSNFFNADFFQARFHKTNLNGANVKQTVLALWRKAEL